MPRIVSGLRRLFVAAALLAVAAPSAKATEILFAQIGTGVGSYATEGFQLSGYLASLSGFNVTNRFLDPSSVYNDYDNFDQIWVYDLSSDTDVYANQMANYNAIANWYNDKGKPHIIADGRILGSSSNWTSRTNGTGHSEEAWIQNYAIQLDLRGGGLVLATDQATAFTRGINEINSLIGINPFTNFWYQEPYEASVDSGSELYIDGLVARDPLYFAPGETCLNDNSSTSDVPYGLQSNGEILYPVAFHGGDITRVAISTTIDGPPPQAESVPAPPAVALLGIAAAGIFAARRRKAGQV